MLTRQNVPFQKRDAHTVSAIRRGGYVLATPRNPRRSSLPPDRKCSWPWARSKSLPRKAFSSGRVDALHFDVRRQPPMYRDVVLIPTWPKVASKAGERHLAQYVGLEGAVVGIDRLRRIGPGAKLFEPLRFHVDNVDEGREKRMK